VFDWYQVNPSKVCISYDGQYLASGNNVGDVCVWNIASKQLLACVSTTYKHFLPNIAMGASTQICTLQFNEQNTRLLSGSLNGRGCIWDLDLNCVNELPNYGTVTAAAFSKDDAMVSVGNTCGIFYTTFYTQKFR
jgi:WD40 repeat protein